ncbi:MAG: class I SAM-dependent methyltransferase [Spirochaetota bacterium]
MIINPRRDIFNEMADNWDNMMTIDEDREKTINHIMNESQIETDDNILDVGCGTGILTPFILDRIGKKGRLTGIDVSDKMINIALKKHKSSNLKFIVGDIQERDIERNGFKRNSFDKIILFSCFPHLDEKEKLLNNILPDLVKRQGKVIICHLDSSQDINNFHSNLDNEILSKDYLPSTKDLSNMLDKSKWDIIKEIDKTGLYLFILSRK